LSLIESQYRIDTDRRTLYGHSYDGVLIRHALINEVSTPLFQIFISIDGSFVSDFYATIRGYGLKVFTIYHQSFDLGHKQVLLPAIRGAIDSLFP